ncbi:MAG: hypothetical protein OQL09_10875 [Gammaproteobacteria bacterium]|nr:hypothetical protein [Gammaproteobacteria bacterium]
MNSSYNYADFIGMNIESNNDSKIRDKDPGHQATNDDKQITSVNAEVNVSIPKAKTSKLPFAS